MRKFCVDMKKYLYFSDYFRVLSYSFIYLQYKNTVRTLNEDYKERKNEITLNN